MPKKRKTVALLVETSNDYARGLLHGIVAYVREHRPWSTYLAEHGRGDAPPTWLSHWGGDGIIARIENPRIAKAVRACNLPTVDLSSAAGHRAGEGWGDQMARLGAWIRRLPKPVGIMACFAIVARRVL